ncbi:chemotaxis protein CheW [Isoptericola rhizosphaerae]|uniref:chemotaxis protein CheW n=1 Tax=Isoptericola rhizosphaerae TaxID=3377837 RepID=UPI00383AF747
MTTQLVTFTLADRLCGILVDQVQEVLPGRARTNVPLAPDDVAGLVNLRGQVVLSVDLRRRLGMPPREDDQMMVVVFVGDETVSLLVDRIGDVLTVDDEQFEAPPQTLPDQLRAVIRGTYKLSDRLLLALDVDAAAS